MARSVGTSYAHCLLQSVVRGIRLMKKLQPVASQDRPKMIAASVGIVIALGVVARSLSGTQILAHSGEAQPAASAPLAAQSAVMPASPAAIEGQSVPGFSTPVAAPAGFG